MEGRHGGSTSLMAREEWWADGPVDTALRREECNLVDKSRGETRPGPR